MKITRINFGQGYLWVSIKGLIEFPINKAVYSVRYGRIVDFSPLSTDENLYLNECFEVVAQTNLELPNVPYVEIREEDVEVEATKAYREYCKEKGITEHLLDSSMFYLGYKVKQAKGKYSEEDMRNLAQYLIDSTKGFISGNIPKMMNFEEYIQSLNKMPDEIEIEMVAELENDWVSSNGYTSLRKSGKLIPFTYTKNNKTYLKVKQK